MTSLLCFAQFSYAQEEQAGESRMGEKSYLLDTIQITDEKDTQAKAYESVNSETVIPKKEITKGNTRDVNDLLQKAPGVSVSGGGELQNKKVSIRGLDGFRVIQTVDGAQRMESTQSGMASGVAVEPEMLSQITVQNGADSMNSIQGAIGGSVQYKTITPEDILIGKEETSVKLKVAADTATEGMARSIHSATRLSKQGSVLLGVTMRDSNRVQSGESSGEDGGRQTQTAESKRNVFLGKYVYKTSTIKTDIKAEYSDTNVKDASYVAGGTSDNSDYRGTVFETVVNHEHSISSNFKYEVLTYFNRMESVKKTHTAYRDIPSTIGTTTDKLDNLGAKVAGVTIVPVTSTVVFQSKNGIEGLGSTISEDDGTASPYYGDSSGYDAGVFTENSLSFSDDKVVLMAGARYTNYHRQSDKLALEAPSKNGDTVSSMVGVSYAPVDWAKVSGKLALSNRAPNVREMYQGSNEIFRCHNPRKDCRNGANPNLEEESAYSKEVSVLFHTPETVEPRRLKVTYFDEDIGNYIQMAADMYRIENGVKIPANPATATNRDYYARNLSKVIRRGIEAQTQMDYKNWEFQAMYSMVRMDCIDCPDMYTATKINEPLYTAPADKYGVAASYEFPSIDLEVGADAQFVSSQKYLSQRYLNAGYASPGYDVYGFNMKWSPKVKDFGQVDVGFGVSNVLDTKYVVHNSPTGTVELGRNYSLSLATIF